MAACTPKSFIVACIACEKAVYLTKTPDDIQAKLGCGDTSIDNFIPTTCWRCEQDSSIMYARLAKTAPPATHDFPGFISASMLGTWWLYAACKEKYGVKFQQLGRSSILVVRIRDFWRQVLGKDGVTAELVVFANRQAVRETNDWRLDTFFGQQSDVVKKAGE